jgi:excisionase family DNA binding protein
MKNDRKKAGAGHKSARKDAPKPIGDRLLTLREAAEVLHLNPRTVRDYVSRGEIEGRIIGGRWRFRRADLDAFFENAPSQSAWECRRCAGLRYSSEGGALNFRTRGASADLRALTAFLGPARRPEPWLPYVFTSPMDAVAAGFAELSVSGSAC